MASDRHHIPDWRHAVRMLLGGHDERVARWVQRHCPLLELSSPFTAIGLVVPREGAELEEMLVAGAVFDNFRGHSIEVHTAAVGKPWNRTFLGECFRYAFVQIDVRRMTAQIAARNSLSRRFVEKLGFSLEGTVREGLPSGEDLCVYGMLKSECRWLEVGLHG